MRVAALFVRTDGPYFGMSHVDPWDEGRDARSYNGNDPVVAHPPCERWGRYWSGGPSAKVRRAKGDDSGCFASAVRAVVLFGGVIEHPAGSHAYAHFGLPKPPSAGRGGWREGMLLGLETPCRAWTTCVSQGTYGHPARKDTWLLYVGAVAPPDLDWSVPRGLARADEGFHSKAERSAARAAGQKPRPRLSKRQLIDTPVPFRDLLIQLAQLSRCPPSNPTL